MNISEPFIRRPVGTTLLAMALFVVGCVAYLFLPVASLPSLDYSSISVSASRPGADPATMAASVAAPLERQLGAIAGVTEITSASWTGTSRILVQFDMSRSLDAAARDVQAAINAALTDLPSDMPQRPFLRKSTDALEPVMILALTSQTLPSGVIFDAADSIIAQRIARVPGVAEARIAGSEQPAIRIQLDPARLAVMGVGIDKVATAITTANVRTAVGSLDGDERSWTIETNDQLATPEDFRGIVVSAEKGVIVKLGDVADVDRGVRNRLAAGWYNGRPAVLINVARQPNANVNEVVEQVKALLPELERWVPAGVDIGFLSDRTQTIRASVGEIQRTLLLSVTMVMGVVFVFLRRATPMIAAGVTLPLSLIGACAAMWVAGYSIDNLSLMALTVSVGFVVDDAIVMIENIESWVARGKSRFEAALIGARQIGFTVVSISLSLIAVFVPLLFMDGLMGRFLREFSYTLASAILISTVVSLTVTPMVCAWMPSSTKRDNSRFDRIVEGALSKIVDWYARSLRPVIDHPRLTLVVIVGTIGWTAYLYQALPKGNLPQDDNGFVNGSTEAAPDVSFAEMIRLQKQAEAIISVDPDVAGVGSSVGGGALTAALNQGRFNIRLKPREERSLSSKQVIARLRKELGKVAGLQVMLTPSQDVFLHARWSASAYQFTLLDDDVAELTEWAPKVLARMRKVPQIVDVTSDRQQGGLGARVVVDRNAASRLGVPISAVDAALNGAFGQRQDSVIYGERNQYRAVLETPPTRQRDLRDLAGIYVSSASGGQVPLSAIARFERSTLPMVVNHQGALPAVTITFNLAPEETLELASHAVERAFAEMNPPSGLRGELAGEAGDARRVGRSMTILIVVALLAVYIILGVLYESLVHPVTIISTLPAAGLGALLSLQMFAIEFSMIAFIGILLLIGIVKKNGIMLVDFALIAEREDGLTPRDAALLAAKERFRPILMTTLAAMFGALPLAFAAGIGTDLRRPLGITIVGGLLLSQLLTLYTTPVIYLLMSKARMPRRSNGSRRADAVAVE
ncbi:MAG TPA: efflux RND transporter permease subunit [Methylosinus sp.]|jgi:multidrug efflux pump|uniref:efflux RND transporter permease subunit n=1 Tax=Methylosinus sp. TaxID=427 RepID=UPI002F952D86